MVNHVIQCSSCGGHYDFRITHNCKEQTMTDGAIEIELQPGESLDEAIMRMGSENNKPKKAPKITVSDPNEGVEVQPEVYGAFHVYQRKQGDMAEPEGVVRANATRERKMHGPGTLVFCHMHSFGEACTPSCRERMA